MHLKCQKCIEDDVYTKKKYLFVKMTPLVRFIHLFMQEYDAKCLKMYLIRDLITLF
jgi:hypothetical protein